MTTFPAMSVPLDEEALIGDLLDLLRIPSVSGSPAEIEVQEHLVGKWRGEGLVVDRWDIDVEGLERDPEFPGMEVARRTAVGVKRAREPSSSRASRGASTSWP